MALIKIIRELIILCSIAVVLAFIVNAVSPKGIALVGDWDKSKGVVNAKAKNDAVIHTREIDLMQARPLFEQGVLFVDARTRDDYDKGHIKGAASLPVEEFWDRIADFQKTYADTLLLITYCSGRECSDSHDLATNLEQVGYKNIKVYIDGFPAWDGAQLPVEKK